MGNASETARQLCFVTSWLIAVRGPIPRASSERIRDDGGRSHGLDPAPGQIPLSRALGASLEEPVAGMEPPKAIDLTK